MSKPDAMNTTLTDNELKEIKIGIGREPNDIELAILDAQWSEHCSYKSSKSLLKLLPTKGKRVLLGPGYDAGVLDVDNNQVITIHIESHNHPSAIDPYGGAATGVGGVLRDILSIGTRPIAVLDSLRFGNIERSANSRWLLKNVVRGISDYGNCVGIPTVGGEVEFDESYEKNCLVDVVSIGLGKRKELVLGEAAHIGDSLILVGGRTGRDGIHGSSFASRDLGVNASDDRSAVQIPDPFTKKLIMDATMEALQSGHVRGLKDLGGGGLACALSEVANSGGTGIDVEISRVHLREKGMNSSEIMISESQERMLFIVEDGFEDDILSSFNKYYLPYSIIGKVTDSKHMIIRKDGMQIVDLPIELIANAPLQLWPSKRPLYLDVEHEIEKPPLPDDINSTIISILSSPNISSKRWIYEQYDREVGVRTVLNPSDSGASILKISDEKFVSIAVDGRPSHCYLDPYNGALGVIAESSRKVISSGAEPMAMVDHLQFGNPSDPNVFWTFSETVRALSDYCKYFDLPCVGGKVSFYNEDGETSSAIKPTPVISVVGLIKGSRRIRSRRFNKKSPLIVLIGETRDELGGSEYYQHNHGITRGNSPKLNFEMERGAQRLVRDAVRVGLLDGVDDCSKGGLIVALAKMCMAGSVGARINMDKILSDCKRWDELLFSESYSRFVVSMNEHNYQGLSNIAQNYGIPFSIIGNIEGSELVLTDNGQVISSEKVETLRDASERTIPALMGDQL